jgi:hypothetical protein
LLDLTLSSRSFRTYFWQFLWEDELTKHFPPLSHAMLHACPNRRPSLSHTDNDWTPLSQNPCWKVTIYSVLCDNQWREHQAWSSPVYGNKPPSNLVFEATYHDRTWSPWRERDLPERENGWLTVERERFVLLSAFTRV